MKPKAKAATAQTNASTSIPGIDPTVAQVIRPGQSVDLLKQLHVLTREGRLNQDSRRKLKQINHLLQFIEPLIKQVYEHQTSVSLVDHGAGKSYLGFMLYDLIRPQLTAQQQLQVMGIETRAELVSSSQQLAQSLGFAGMQFLNLPAADAAHSNQLSAQIDIVTALHACNTATDDAIAFALAKHAQHIVLVPCCQAEVAAAFRHAKATADRSNPLGELWRRPLHTREFGSQLTNVLRCLQLEAHGYVVTVTELVGWEHSMKNELIIASVPAASATHRSQLKPNLAAAKKLHQLLDSVGLPALQNRFFTPEQSKPVTHA